MTDSNQTPPDWILIEAAERSNFAYSINFIRNNYGTMSQCYRALCDMIAKHEQPPVDRKLLCAREALSHTAFVYDPARDMVSEGERVCIRAIELYEEGFGHD